MNEGLLNRPDLDPPLSQLDKRQAAVRELCKQLENDSHQYGCVRATLTVNCAPGRLLAKFGCTYDESQSVHTNLVGILEKLTKLIPESAVQTFIDRVASQLDAAAIREFRPMEQWALRKSMEVVGMVEYPPLVGDPQGERTSGDMICQACGKEYNVHPSDWRLIGYGNVPFLTVLCDGRRVKL